MSLALIPHSATRLLHTDMHTHTHAHTRTHTHICRRAATQPLCAVLTEAVLSVAGIADSNG